MKLVKYVKVVLCTLMLCFTVNAVAQSNADKLFMEGQELMKTMTIKKQQQAIDKFKAAKIAYTPAEKKQMCDNQIAICNRNIQTIRVNASKNNKPEPQQEEKKEEPQKPKHENVVLELSKSRLDFKAEPKDGYTQSVKVRCNYTDWTIASQPEWTTIYTASGEFSVKVENNEGDDRSGIIKVQCGDKSVDLIVNQSRLKGIKKMVKSVKQTFDI